MSDKGLHVSVVPMPPGVPNLIVVDVVTDEGGQRFGITSAAALDDFTEKLLKARIIAYGLKADAPPVEHLRGKL